MALLRKSISGECKCENRAVNTHMCNCANSGTCKETRTPFPTFPQETHVETSHDSADSSLVDTVELFKIDAQGHELPILHGMKKILSSGARRFALFVEVSDMLQLAAGHDPKDIEK